jgi:hypothetical protein
MGDERDDRSGPAQEGFIESTLRDATLTGGPDDPKPPDEPQGAAFPRHGDDADDDADDADRSARG